MTSYIEGIRNKVGNDPIILVGATIIVVNENKILLQYRADTKEWGLPGGAMEVGESLVETAERELYEETGLKAQSFEFINTFSGQDLYFKYPNGDETYNVISAYLVKNPLGQPTINDNESLQLDYFSLYELPARMDSRAKIILNYFHEKGNIFE